MKVNYLKWLNRIVLQWFFVRLTKVEDKENNLKWYSLKLFVVPLSGYFYGSFLQQMICFPINSIYLRISKVSKLNEKLENGETFVTKEFGNSMLPLLKSGQEHKLSPVTWEQVEVGDIVYCKVHGRFYTHLVKAKDELKGCQIGNNKGHINGWTKCVYGKVIVKNYKSLNVQLFVTKILN